PWVAKFDAVMDNYAGDTPRQSTGRWRRIFNDPRFRHQTSKSYGYTQPMLASGIVDRALSTSFIAALPGSEQVAVLQQVERRIAEESMLAGQREVELPYLADVFPFPRA